MRQVWALFHGNPLRLSGSEDKIVSTLGLGVAFVLGLGDSQLEEWSWP